MKIKRQFFLTLNEALVSENLGDTWPIEKQELGKGQSFSYVHRDGSKHGRYISVSRAMSGMYARPVHYLR